VTGSAEVYLQQFIPGAGTSGAKPRLLAQWNNQPSNAEAPESAGEMIKEVGSHDRNAPAGV
jgi:hypothetical protein